jgi:tRNA dimethylallyltransferase
MMDIGTAKPPKKILKEIPHHFIDIIDPDEEYNAGQFGTDARKRIGEIFSREHLPIVVGGSGLYIRSLVDGMFEGARKDEAVRQVIEKRLEEEGPETLLKELHSVDPSATMTMKTLHRRRLVRALEVYHATGVPLSRWQAKKIAIDFEPVFIGLRWERKQLYEMINSRVDDMMKEGLLDEVKKLEDKGYTDKLQSLNTPGYKELFAHLRNEISLERAVELIKQHTRNYAKRQMTWFNAEKRMRWFDMSSYKEIENIAILLASSKYNHKK